MSCIEDCAGTPPQLIKGDDAFIDVRLTTQPSKNPLVLDGVTEIIATLLNNDGSYLFKKLSTAGIVIVSSAGGHFQIVIPTGESVLLAASLSGGYSDIQLQLTIGGKLKNFNLKGVISIVEKTYPSA